MERSSVANLATHFSLKVGRRRIKRIDIEAVAEVTIISGSDGAYSKKPLIGRTINLSESGALLLLPRTEIDNLTLDPRAENNVNNVCEVKINVDDDPLKSFNGLAKVIWTEPMRQGSHTFHLVGIRFVKLYNQDKETLRQVLLDNKTGN